MLLIHGPNKKTFDDVQRIKELFRTSNQQGNDFPAPSSCLFDYPSGYLNIRFDAHPVGFF